MTANVSAFQALKDVLQTERQGVSADLAAGVNMSSIIDISRQSERLGEISLQCFVGIGRSVRMVGTGSARELLTGVIHRVMT